MEFQRFCDEARTWTKKESTFSLDSIDEEEKKINFSIQNTDLTFSVTCPSTGNEWMVWSENEDALPFLQELQDYTGNNRQTKTIQDILVKVKSVFTELISTRSKEEDSDEDEDFDNYYEGEDSDMDVQEPQAKAQEEDSEEENFFSGGMGPNSTAVQRLYKDLKSFKKEALKFGLDGGPRNDNLFVWDIKLIDIPDSKLAKDLEKFSKAHNTEPCIHLEMMFPKDYPMSPPFVRVIRPRFKFLTGHVTVGGSICMEMLTKSGWTPTNDIENILVQIRCEILSDPNAQLDSNNANNAYTETEARDAFRRMVQRYGWDK